MIVGLRRVVTGLVAGVVVALGAGPVLSASAETPSPSPVATVSATATATATPGTDSETPDVAPDNSRQAWALGGAGVVALVAAAAVFLRRR
jgi:hypothetical protein